MPLLPPFRGKNSSASLFVILKSQSFHLNVLTLWYVGEVSDPLLGGCVLGVYSTVWIDLQITACKFLLLPLSLVCIPYNSMFKLSLLICYCKSTKING